MTRALAPPLLAAFFAFATTMTALVAMTLLAPGGGADAIWKVKPDAYAQLLAFAPASGWAFAALSVLMAATCVGCFTRRNWGWMLAVGVIAANAIGDGVRIASSPLEGSAGVVIAGAILYWFTRPTTRALFDR